MLTVICNSDILCNMKKPTSFKEWRDSLNINQEDAAKRLGVEQGTYSRYENGEARPAGPRCQEISEITGIPLSAIRPDIFGGVNA